MGRFLARDLRLFGEGLRKTNKRRVGRDRTLNKSTRFLILADASCERDMTKHNAESYM